MTTLAGRSHVQHLIDAAERTILEAVFTRAEPLVVVNSPPGAGKTSLVEAVCALAADMRWRVAVATSTNEQAWDLLRRLTADYPLAPTQLLHAVSKPPPAGLDGGAARPPVTDARMLGRGPLVVIGTGRKFQFSTSHLAEPFDLLIVDEAYQVTYAAFRPIAHIGRQTLLVGDPGQLPPVTKVDVTRFEAAPFKVHWPAPQELLRAHPEVTAYQLPASRRLPQDTVDMVQPAFYPRLPFVSAAPERRLRFAAAGMGTPVDRALDLVAGGASVVVLTLPRLIPDHDPTDPELADVSASVVERFLARGPSMVDGAGVEISLSGRSVGMADQHVASGATTTRQLRRRGLGPDTVVDTPEIWQGLERPVMVVKHPLSGSTDLGDFSLAPGRLSVMTSRHQIGCVLVTRDGIADDLLAHVHSSGTRPSGARDATWDGFSAHVRLWQWLATRDRIVHT